MYVVVCSVARFDVSFGTVCLMYVQIIMSSVKVAEWLPFGKELFPCLTICSLLIMSSCNLSYIPF